MGSSTSGKKHKKEKKHKRNRSLSSGDEEESSSSRHRHHHKHKKHKELREYRSHRDERHKRHRHHRHDSERHDKDYEKRRSEVIDVKESDSDSSDCVEVPITESAKTVTNKKTPDRTTPPPPSLAKSSQRDAYEHTTAHRSAIREECINSRDREDIRNERGDIRRDRQDSRRDRDDIAYRRENREDMRHPYRNDIHDLSNSRHRERELSPPLLVARETPPPPKLGKRKHELNANEQKYDDGPPQLKEKPLKSSQQSLVQRYSPIPENGAGDVLSIEETNKLRAKLGLKPLEIESHSYKSAPVTKDVGESDPKRKATEKDLSKYKDEWGEFLHKPADNLKEKAEAEKMREKLKVRKEKRFLDERLKHIKTLGESDEEVDDVKKWVQRSKKIVDEKKEAQKRAEALEAMDAEFGVSDLADQDRTEQRRKAYSDRNLKGLRVEHDVQDFSEGKTVILTLKDKDVLDENDGDALINVNMIDDERYRTNVANKKKNPLSYGYNVYEEQYDELGNPIDRGILAKYDEDLDGKSKKKKDFVIGENLEHEKERKRHLLEIKTKLQGKRLETLADINLEMARDTFSEIELAKFKKPKKKVRKIRQKLKVDDLFPLNDESLGNHLGSRRGHMHLDDDNNDVMNTDIKPDITDIKVIEEEDNLERVLNKARKLKQKENLIKKPLLIDIDTVKKEIKTERTESESDENIVLNSTAEFCRTLGEIPTYGMSGNRNVGDNDRMDYEEVNETGELLVSHNLNLHDDEEEMQHGTWNSVNPEELQRPVDLDVGGNGNGDDVEDIAILDEEPDVGAGVANALKLALSKGYLEKEERKRPSNSKMAHLQAKNYSIEDKSAGDDEKVARRDRYHAGPIMDFKDKDSFKPNVKLEYIDDNGRILNLKEAFRYLSHKFHGKGPGKNKIEKRLKKMEQEGLMKTMSSTDTPLGTLTMLQQKQKETKTPYVVLSGGKQTPGNTTISKFK